MPRSVSKLLNPVPKDSGDVVQPKPGDRKQQAKDNPNKDNSKRRAWHFQKPKEDSLAWSLPTGKSFNQYFGSNKKGRENTARIQTIQAPHHLKSKTRQPVCPKYACGIKCERDRKDAHAPLFRIRKNSEGKQLIHDLDAAYAEIFA